jgi:hypothetical protein
MNKLDKFYEILGVPPDCPPATLRQAYRDLVKVWHPDRFSHDLRLQKIAEEKLREINEAYEALFFFLNTDGTKSTDKYVVSCFGGPRFEIESPLEFRWPADSLKWRQGAKRIDEANSKLTAKLLARLRHRLLSTPRLHKKIAIFLLIVTVSYAFLAWREVQTESVGKDSLVSNSPTPTLDLTPRRNKNDASDRVSKNDTDQIAENQPRPQLRASIESQAGIVGFSKFTLGSGKNDVLAIQGIPDRMTSSSLHFGSSDVYFNEFGRVIGWSNRKPQLKVVLIPSTSTSNKYFTIGSSADEVIAIQGTPDVLTKDSYYYGTSEVFLENNRVTGWYNSQPKLKVQLLPSKAVTLDHFSLGSTMDEVLSVQGTPDRVTTKSLHYGTSDIVFEQGRVTEWYNGVPKLKVKQPSSKK